VFKEFSSAPVREVGFLTKKKHEEEFEEDEEDWDEDEEWDEEDEEVGEEDDD